MGAVDFTAEMEDGSEFSVDWAGDSTDFSTMRLTTPDGVEWFGPADGLAVEITGDDASVSGTLTSGAGDGAQAELTAELSCP